MGPRAIQLKVPRLGRGDNDNVCIVREPKHGPRIEGLVLLQGPRAFPLLHGRPDACASDAHPHGRGARRTLHGASSGHDGLIAKHSHTT